ncbi:MAG: hypothetical protein WEA82_09995 [Idiomarina sp.]
MKLNMLKSFLLIVTVTISLGGCGGSSDSDELTIYRVSVASKPMYFGVGAASTPVIDGVAVVQGGVDTVASDIFNFDYEFGTSYELRVTQLKAAADGSDGSTQVLTDLVEVSSSEADGIGTEYVYNEVELIENPFSDKEDGVYGFYQYEFLCADSVDCDGLVAIGDSGGLVELIFEYTGGDVPITLVEWN